MFEVSALEIVVVVLKTVRATVLVTSFALRLVPFRAADPPGAIAGTLSRCLRTGLFGSMPMNIAFNSATLPHQTQSSKGGMRSGVQCKIIITPTFCEADYHIWACDIHTYML